MSEHSPEPWSYRDSSTYDDERGAIVSRDDEGIAETYDRNGDRVSGDANGPRIVACVNFLAGIPTDLLEAVLKDHTDKPPELFSMSPLLAMRQHIVQWVEYNPRIFGLWFGTFADVPEEER